jgi:hypothetical protein
MENDHGLPVIWNLCAPLGREARSGARLRPLQLWIGTYPGAELARM